MKFESANSDGSFNAWGTGLLYKYQSEFSSLDIFDPTQSRAYARLKFNSYKLKRPRLYLEHFDRANQIKALIFSNNHTNNLADTMDRRRMGAILHSTAKSSRLALSLKQADYDYFADYFKEETGLKSAKIKKFISNDRLSEFYVGRILTQNNNCTSVRACTLSGLLEAMSESTMRDLVTTEYGCKQSAKRLLGASHKMSFLASILDDEFTSKIMLKTEDSKSGLNSF